jgi:multidrug resistance protein, MATE family
VRELLALALPTVAQMASYTVMQFIDTWMLAHSADRVIAPTAAANSGILAFSVISLGMGCLWVVNTLVSQAYGRKDYAACGRYLWQGVWFALVFAACVLPVLPVIGRIFVAAGHEPHLVDLETRYIQIVLGASVVKLVGTAFGQFLLAIDRPRQVMLATIAGVSVNAVAAWVLVFGHLGLPPRGVIGAAWAQNIGVTVEMLALIFFATRPAVRRAFNVRDWLPRPEALRTLLKVGIPSGVQTVADVLAWSAFQMWVMGVFGTASMAANAFVFRYMSVSFMPAYGLSVAVTALVGRYIGMGRPDVAIRRADLGFVVAAAYMLLCGLAFFLGRNVLIGLFASEEQVRRVGAMLLVFAAVYQFFDAMYIVYNGALRGAGDTLMPAVMTGVLCWSITVFGGYAVARWWNALGPAGPWVTATAYGVILGIFMLARFRRGGWRSIRLEEPRAADTVREFDVAMPLRPDGVEGAMPP